MRCAVPRVDERSRACGGTHGRVDLGGEEVEVAAGGVVGIERMKAEALPPGSCPSVDRGNDDRATRCLLVEINGRREHVGDQRGTDPKAGMSAIDRKAANQKSGNRIGGALSQIAWRGRTIDRGHGEACVGDDRPVRSGYHPGRCGIASTILSGIPPEPLVEGGFAGIEAGAVVTSRIEQLWTA